jgi:hypothetical protein
MRRPDGVITQERLDELTTMLKGHYKVPDEAYESEDIAGRERFVELPEEALRMIANGWMCGSGGCLAMFRIPLTHCPACGEPTGAHHIVARSKVPGADLWDEHRKALDESQPRDRLPSGPMSPDDWIARIHGNPEGDHTTISKLKKRRRP